MATSFVILCTIVLRYLAPPPTITFSQFDSFGFSHFNTLSAKRILAICSGVPTRFFRLYVAKLDFSVKELYTTYLYDKYHLMELKYPMTRYLVIGTLERLFSSMM